MLHKGRKSHNKSRKNDTTSEYGERLKELRLTRSHLSEKLSEGSSKAVAIGNATALRKKTWRYSIQEMTYIGLFWATILIVCLTSLKIIITKCQELLWNGCTNCNYRWDCSSLTLWIQWWSSDFCKHSKWHSIVTPFNKEKQYGWCQTYSKWRQLRHWRKEFRWNRNCQKRD